MVARRTTAAVARTASVLAVVCCLGASVSAAPVSSEEMGKLCANAEGAAHCGRLIEEAQLKRLPNLAVRDGTTLKVSLYPAGTATFADVDAANGGRSYSLWDYLDAINAVLLYTTDGDDVTFTLLQRSSGRKVELPTEPKLAPDRQRLVTADFCAKRCSNELVIWSVTNNGVHKEYTWKPQEAWIDAGATWKDADTLQIEFTPAGAGKAGAIERRLADPGWIRSSPP